MCMCAGMYMWVGVCVRVRVRVRVRCVCVFVYVRVGYVRVCVGPPMCLYERVCHSHFASIATLDRHIRNRSSDS